MKKLFFCLIALMAMPIVFAQPVVHHFAEDVYEGEPITVHVVAKMDSELKGFDIGEFLPETWKVDTWWIQNYEKSDVLFESENGEFLKKEHNINHWAFESLSKEIALSYTISPKPAGNYELVSVWFYPEGFEMDMFNVTVKEKPANMITGFAVSEPAAVSSAVKSTVTVRQSVNNVLANVNAISLY